MNVLLAPASLLGRLLIAALFIWAGAGKIFNWSQTATHMEHAGVPVVPVALALTIAVEMIGGGLIAIGYHARLAAIVLFLFLIPATAMFHNFWVAPPETHYAQLTNFMKNLGIMGGLLHIVGTGAGGLSLDRFKKQ